MVAVNGVEESAAADGIGYGSSFQDLKFTWTDAATITAGVADKAVDETAHILMFDSEGNPRWFEFTGTQAIAITTDGVNGLETTCYNTEGEEASHNYHVFCVGQSDGTVGFLMVDDDDYAAGWPTWSLPSGYTYVSGPAWYVRNDGSSNLVAFSDSIGFCQWDLGFDSLILLDGGTSTTYADLTSVFACWVPPWATDFTIFGFQNQAGLDMSLSFDGGTSEHVSARGPYRQDILCPQTGTVHYKVDVGVSTTGYIWGPRWRR